MRCDQVSILLAASADESAVLQPEPARHVASCLRCQAEAVQYRRLLRDLGAMRHQLVAPDARMLDEILAGARPLAEVTKLHRKARRKAVIGGFAAAATAGAAGAIVIATRLAGRQSIAS